MTNNNIMVYPILLAGGAGSRLWPVSRELFPKQFVSLLGGESLIQNTIKRLSPALDLQKVRVVCGKDHFDETKKHLEAMGLTSEGKIFAEPCGRNTAPAILLAVLNITKTEEDAILLVFPADHVITNVEEYQKKLKTAISLAEKDHIVTFGIKPNYPETGYGYIEGGVPAEDGALKIKRFVEKPDEETARHYLEAGNFFWNSGMFAFKASVMIEEFKANAPNILEKMQNIVSKDNSAQSELYEELPNISIDYAIMEKTGKGVVLPSDFGWSDIGSWKSLYDILPKDNNNNVAEGDVILRETKNSFIRGEKRLVVVNGLENVVVVETSDAIFVSDLNKSKDVKLIVNELKARNRVEYKAHSTMRT